VSECVYLCGCIVVVRCGVMRCVAELHGAMGCDMILFDMSLAICV
jgi:hypothetical protein